MPVEAEDVQGFLATGINPHYRPPINRWRTVEVKVPPGMIAGLVLDSEPTGLLVIVIHAGEEWPETVELAPGHEARKMTAERPFFRVTNDDRGPAVGHEFEPDPEDRTRCLRCLAPRIPRTDTILPLSEADGAEK